VPRCTGLSCVQPGGSCVTAADCCTPDGGLAPPCVPVDGGGFQCFQGGACVKNCGACTTNADCCAGETCQISQGSTMGICGPCQPPPPPPPEGGVPEGGSSSGGSSSGGSSSGGSSSGGSSSGGSSSSSSSSGGSSSGSSSGGPTCALYGQVCDSSTPCCNGIPCTGGRCLSF
jgi:hypothetical protein